MAQPAGRTGEDAYLHRHPLLAGHPESSVSRSAQGGELPTLSGRRIGGMQPDRIEALPEGDYGDQRGEEPFMKRSIMIICAMSEPWSSSVLRYQMYSDFGVSPTARSSPRQV